MVWIIFALLTGIAVLAVLWPLSRVPLRTDARELDVAFYRAQTAEIERDAARGVIAPGEAEVARTEAARRLVAASHRVAPVAVRSSPWLVRGAAVTALVFIPALAVGLYLRIGAPGMPDQPLDARLNADAATMDMAALIARVERNVARNPDDGRGWSLLGRIYARLGRSEDAVNAFRNEIRVLGPSDERLSSLGETETAAAGGRVTADARTAFEQAVAANPKSPRARYYLGLASEQDGDKTAAVTTWKRLVADAPPNAPWLPAVEARIAAVGGEPAPFAGPNGKRDDTARGETAMARAVAAMPANEQQAMIHRMVDGLADRLKGKGDDIDGWLRLVRAYRVLDEGDKARGALTDARRNFAGNAQATKRLDDLAHELGLES